MKKLLLLSALLIFSFVFGQGEQRYADGTATDQDGNTFEWINYGTQDWAIENAGVVTYRDGTPIPQVTDNEWTNLTTGAWCYYDNDPTKARLYNWNAVSGILDNDESTANKEFAPEGWRVPSDEDWTELENYLQQNGYEFDGPDSRNEIARSLASTSGWWLYTDMFANGGEPGYNQTLNNTSGFNAVPVGWRASASTFYYEGGDAYFWGSDINGYYYGVQYYRSYFLKSTYYGKGAGFPVRFVRDATSLSTTDFSNSIIMYPNPVKNMLTIDGLVVKDIVIYSVLGKAVLKMSNQNTIDVSALSKGVYFIKVSDGINASTKKFIKE